jgi:hypothetical protein
LAWDMLAGGVIGVALGRYGVKVQGSKFSVKGAKFIVQLSDVYFPK